MSKAQHRRQAALAVLCAVCAVAFVTLAWAFTRDPFHGGGVLMVLWWASGIAAFAFGIAACRVEEDATDNAHYLGSIVHGLRDEWRRS